MLISRFTVLVWLDCIQSNFGCVCSILALVELQQIETIHLTGWIDLAH